MMKPLWNNTVTPGPHFCVHKPQVSRNTHNRITSRLVRISQSQLLISTAFIFLTTIFLLPERIMTVPPEQANQALEITLATLQSLMKRCIKVKEGDPEALRLSDEIARRVVSVPNIALKIVFAKLIHLTQAKDLKMYGGSATSFSPQLLSFAAVVRENSKGGAFESVPDWTSVTNDDPRIKSHPRFDKTVDYISPSLDDLSTDPATANPPTTLTTPTTITLPSASTSMPSLMESDVLVEPEAETNGSSGLRKGEAKDHPIPIDTPTSPPAKYNLFVPGTKKRKPAAEDTDEAVVVPTNKSPSPSEEPVKKKKKVESQPIARPAVWGSDADIATPWKVCLFCIFMIAS
jgi:hypothetical protein